MIDIVPGPGVIAAALGVVVFAGALWILSFGSPSLRPPFTRYVAATGLAFVVLAFGLALIPGAAKPAEIAAGLLLLFTAILLGFVFWSLVAFGFTITMLTVIAAARKPLSFEGWVTAYAGGGINQIVHDRLGILLAARLARVEGECAVITPLGRFVAAVIGLLRTAVGLGK